MIAGYSDVKGMEDPTGDLVRRGALRGLLRWSDVQVEVD